MELLSVEQQEEMEVVDHWRKPEQSVPFQVIYSFLFSEERMEECMEEYE